MWVATVIAVLLLPIERAPVLARSKSLIFSYAVVLIVGRWFLTQTAAASPREWAALIGGVGEAQDVLAQNRSVITTLITLGVMLWRPAATLLYLGQRVQRRQSTTTRSERAALSPMTVIKLESFRHAETAQAGVH